MLSPARARAPSDSVTIRLKRVRRAIHRNPEARRRRSGRQCRWTVDLLRRLRCIARRTRFNRIEVDRLDQDEGASLEPDQPVEYERDDLAADIEYLAQLPQAATARDLGLTERGWRKIIKTLPNSKATTVERIREIAALYRSRSGR